MSPVAWISGRSLSPGVMYFADSLARSGWLSSERSVAVQGSVVRFCFWASMAKSLSRSDWSGVQARLI